MKKWRQYLSLLLMCVLTVSLLPVQTLAAAVEGAYTVLVENAVSVNVYQLGDPYEDVNVVNGESVMKYDGSSGIQTVNLGVTVSEYVYSGFTSSGYALVDKYTDNTAVIDAAGKVVYRPDEGEQIESMSDDGYLVLYHYDSTVSSFTYSVVELSTGEKFQQSDWVAQNGTGKSVWGCGEGLVLVQEVSLDPQTNDYVYTYSYLDLNGNTIASGDFDYAQPFANGYAVVNRSEGSEYYSEVIDKTGRVVLSSQNANGVSISGVGSDNMVSLWDADYNRAYVKLTDGLNSLPSARYNNGRDFRNGYAVVWNNNWEAALIDTEGNTVIPFGRYDDLSNVSDTGLVWAVDQNSRLCLLKVNSTAPEYIYDQEDPGADLVLPAEKLDDVETRAQAVRAVKNLTSSMTQEQKTAPTGIDLATLYAETAAAKVATKKVTGSELLINAAALKDLQNAAQQTTEAVESALVSGGVTTARYVAKTATLSTSATGARSPSGWTPTC